MIRKTLTSGWTLRREGYPEVYRVDGMPKMVHDVLLENGVIETPWLPGKTLECRWVGESEWVYETRFDAPGDRGYLDLGGVYVLADVYLNGARLGSCANIYAPHRFGADFLPEGNDLKVVIHPGITPDGQKRTDVAYRTGRHDFDTYLGNNPFFCRAGLFRDVTVCCPGAGKSNSSAPWAVLDGGGGQVRLRASAPAGRRVAHRPDRGRRRGRHLGAGGEIRRARFSVDTMIPVPDPALWNPVGRGPAESVYADPRPGLRRAEADRRKKTVGFRTLDSPSPCISSSTAGLCASTAAGLAPVDQVTLVWNRSGRRKSCAGAEGNMNTVRVWCEGEPVPDGFYDLCDRMAFWSAGFLRSASAPRRPGNLPAGSGGDGGAAEHHPSIILGAAATRTGCGTSFITTASLILWLKPLKR
jgi:hypothetical protein